MFKHDLYLRTTKMDSSFAKAFDIYQTADLYRNV